MARMRDLIGHHYDKVDPQVVRSTMVRPSNAWGLNVKRSWRSSSRSLRTRRRSSWKLPVSARSSCGVPTWDMRPWSFSHSGSADGDSAHRGRAMVSGKTGLGHVSASTAAVILRSLNRAKDRGGRRECWPTLRQTACEGRPVSIFDHCIAVGHGHWPIHRQRLRRKSPYVTALFAHGGASRQGYARCSAGYWFEFSRGSKHSR